MVTVSGWEKRYAAKTWNAEHAEIEVCTVKDYTELRAHFLEEADGLRAQIDREKWYWSETSDYIRMMTARESQCRAIAESL